MSPSEAMFKVQSPKSKVQSPKLRPLSISSEFGHWTLAFGLRWLLLVAALAQPMQSARAQTPGSIDLTFTNQAGTDGDVHGLAVQSDGKVVLAGNFFTVNGVARSGIARLNTNGVLDTTFMNGLA